MKRTLSLCVLVLAGFAAGGAGCSGDPNVEGAKLDLRNRDYPKALANVNAALAKKPNDAAALELKGDILTQMALAATTPAEVSSQTRDAATAYRAAVAADAKRASTITGKNGMLYGQVYAKAVQAFNRGSTDPAAFEQAAAYFEAAGSVQPDSAAPYVYRGYSLLRMNREQEAIEPLRTGLDKGFNEAAGYLALSQLYVNASRPADAVTLLEQGAQRFPNEADLQRQLLTAYLAAGQTDRAMAGYQQRIQAEPANAVYRYNYGALLLQAKQYPQAVEQLSEAVRIAPDNGDAQYNLGAAYINQAVDLNTQVQSKEDALRAERASLSATLRTQRETEINGLVAQRTAMFRQAVGPLTRAYEIRTAAAQPAQEVCRALFQSLAQTNQRTEAQRYAQCAGFGDTN